MDITDPTRENVETLLAMGFPSESEIRRALKLTKNDLSEAVDMLTNEDGLSTTHDVPHIPSSSGGSQDSSAITVSTYLYMMIIIISLSRLGK